MRCEICHRGIKKHNQLTLTEYTLSFQVPEEPTVISDAETFELCEECYTDIQIYLESLCKLKRDAFYVKKGE